jgi:hypothetical protein
MFPTCQPSTNSLRKPTRFGHIRPGSLLEYMAQLCL